MKAMMKYPGLQDRRFATIHAAVQAVCLKVQEGLTWYPGYNKPQQLEPRKIQRGIFAYTGLKTVN